MLIKRCAGYDFHFGGEAAKCPMPAERWLVIDGRKQEFCEEHYQETLDELESSRNR